MPSNESSMAEHQTTQSFSSSLDGESDGASTPSTEGGYVGMQQWGMVMPNPRQPDHVPVPVVPLNQNAQTYLQQFSLLPSCYGKHN